MVGLGLACGIARRPERGATSRPQSPLACPTSAAQCPSRAPVVRYRTPRLCAVAAAEPWAATPQQGGLEGGGGGAKLQFCKKTVCSSGGDWRLAVGGGWRLAVGGWCRLAVGSWWSPSSAPARLPKRGVALPKGGQPLSNGPAPPGLVTPAFCFHAGHPTLLQAYAQV